MTSSTLLVGAGRRSIWQSIGAVVFGFVTVFVLSLGTDQALHAFHVYPPWGQAMYDPGLNLLALSYRIVYTIFGGYLAARLAPHSHGRHALVLGLLGLGIGILSTVATAPMNLGPAWYPMAIAATALPCSWAGGRLYRARLSRRTRPT